MAEKLWDVFVSYSSKDENDATTLVESLECNGVKCWFSKRDMSTTVANLINQGVLPRGSWSAAIPRIVEQSKSMVFVLSGRAVDSAEVKKELDLANKYKLITFPVIIESVELSSEFEYHLAGQQTHSCFASQEPQRFAEFTAYVKGSLGCSNLAIVPDSKSIGDSKNSTPENTSPISTETVSVLAENSEKFAHEVREAIEDNGAAGLNEHEQKHLEDIGIDMGLTVDQAKIVIKNAVECDATYLQEIAKMLADGIITALERKILTSKAKSLGISDSRAQALLEQEKAKLGLSDTSTPAAIPSPITVAPVKNEDGISSPEPDETSSSGNSISDGLSWPSVGYNFLKALRRELEVYPLPFELVWITEDEDIDSNGEAIWQINEKHYFSARFDPKSRRSGKVTIYWGFYSDNMVKDPLFRDICKAIGNMPDVLEDDGIFWQDNHMYEFFSDGYLGFETSERPSFEEMAQGSYIKNIAGQLLAFSQKIKPVIMKAEGFELPHSGAQF